MYDGQKSHINLTLQEWVKANDIIFYVLPPHTLHVTQPLDVGCFGPLNRAYYTEFLLYLRKIPGMPLNRYNIAKLSGVWQGLHSRQCVWQGLHSRQCVWQGLHSRPSFRKSGISPSDPSKISQDKTAPSLIYKETEKENEPPNTFLESGKRSQALRTERKRKHQSITGKDKKEINIEQLPTQNKKQPTKQRANIGKAKPSISFTSTQPQVTTSGLVRLQQQPQLLDSADSDSDRLSEIPEEDLGCVCKKISLDAMHLLYTIE